MLTKPTIEAAIIIGEGSTVDLTGKISGIGITAMTLRSRKTAFLCIFSPFLI
jgi:hypothetical protein